MKLTYERACKMLKTGSDDEMNIAHARQEIGRFCAEVSHPPAGTKSGEETSACREEYPRMRNVNVIL